jgi:hypothetical protein
MTVNSCEPKESSANQSSFENIARQWGIELIGLIKKVIWRGKIGPAFWTFTGLVSVVVNLILVTLLIGLGRELFTIKYIVNEQLLGGLHSNFVKMDEAHIVTTIEVVDVIQVVDSIPVVFDLLLSQDTEVRLTQNTVISNATIFLNGQAIPMRIILPEGTALNINLDMVVPVNKMVPIVLDVPIHLTVPVDIPLNQTDLHEPFVGLQEVVGPYHRLLSDLPDSWENTPLCGPLTESFCQILLKP